MAEITLTPRQAEFVTDVLSWKFEELLYGGAMGGGKSVVVVQLLALLCKMFPGSRWVIVRKDLNRCRETIMKTWKRDAPAPFFAPINSEFVAVAQNGSEVRFMGEQLDTDPELNRFRGLEVNGFVFEEANECSEACWDIAGMRAGRWKCSGRQPPPLRIATCNPNGEWPKRKFHDPWKRGELSAPMYYLPAYITDNPNLDPAYVKSLQRMPEEIRRVMIEGNWDAAELPNQLIKNGWIERSIKRGFELHKAAGVLRPWVTLPRSMGVDVAREGDDNSVLATMGMNALERMATYHGYDNVQVANEVALVAKPLKIPGSLIKVDGIGNGSGVIDTLKHTHHLVVTPFIAGARPSLEDAKGTDAVKDAGGTSVYTFKNLRAEAWWGLREAFFADQFAIGPEVKGKVLIALQEELTAVRYFLDSDKYLEIEPKKDTKARLKRSPDHADSVVMGNWTPRYAHFWAGITTR